MGGGVKRSCEEYPLPEHECTSFLFVRLSISYCVSRLDSDVYTELEFLKQKCCN